MSSMIHGRLVRVSSVLTFGAAVALILAAMASATSPIVHRVSVGTPDACLDLAGTHPGCDGNFSCMRCSAPTAVCPANTRTDSHEGMAFTLSLTAWWSTETKHGSAV